MKELMKDTLYSFDEKVRVEIGPQIIELDCTDENLSNKVTHANYQEGKIDAFGKTIAKGKKMNCVDWKGKHVPHLWKVYQVKECEIDKKTKKPVFRFIKINEFKDKKEALAFAETTFEGMQ